LVLQALQAQLDQQAQQVQIPQLQAQLVLLALRVLMVNLHLIINTKRIQTKHQVRLHRAMCIGITPFKF
jgi:hypothetical protein